MAFQVEESLPGWLSLCGGRNWASIEGPVSDWLVIADAIDNRGSVSFRRCAVTFASGQFCFWSPRNAVGSGDTVVLTESDGIKLAAQIREVAKNLRPVETME